MIQPSMYMSTRQFDNEIMSALKHISGYCFYFDKSSEIWYLFNNHMFIHT